ncbi:MAG: hypothetical protein NXI32_05500 [bacterium]|nr:hypothetical protein [bacterium]
MNECHRTESTERIKGEDWCVACKKPVGEWSVYFEESIHTDSGYDKVRRCPHCNEKCFEDGNFSLGCFFFFVGLFGLPPLWLGLLNQFGLAPELDFDHAGTALGFLAFAILNGAALSTLVAKTYKWCLYRDKP